MAAGQTRRLGQIIGAIRVDGGRQFDHFDAIVLVGAGR